MPYRKDKFKCTKCDNNVSSKTVLLCKFCRAKKFGVALSNDTIEARKERLKEYKKRYYKNNKTIIDERNKKNRETISSYQKYLYHIKSKYKISESEYITLLEQHNFKCSCCSFVQQDKYASKKNDKLYIDHDHKTGLIRGLLCQKCNSALGLIKDNIEILKNLIKYLQCES